MKEFPTLSHAKRTYAPCIGSDAPAARCRGRTCRKRLHNKRIRLHERSSSSPSSELVAVGAEPRHDREAAAGEGRSDDPMRAATQRCVYHTLRGTWYRRLYVRRRDRWFFGVDADQHVREGHARDRFHDRWRDDHGGLMMRPIALFDRFDGNFGDEKLVVVFPTCVQVGYLKPVIHRHSVPVLFVNKASGSLSGRTRWRD
jgi:hypothetical protein